MKCQSPSRGTGISTEKKGQKALKSVRVNPLPGEPAFLPLVANKEKRPVVCQSPSRGTGISTLLIASLVIMLGTCVNPLTGEPAFLPYRFSEDRLWPLKCQSPYRGTGISTDNAVVPRYHACACQSPYRGTGISTLLSQNAMPERFSEV